MTPGPLSLLVMIVPYVLPVVATASVWPYMTFAVTFKMNVSSSSNDSTEMPHESMHGF